MNLNELAINGGTPVRNSEIYYGRQWIGEDDVKAVSEALVGCRSSRGPGHGPGCPTG